MKHSRLILFAAGMFYLGFSISPAPAQKQPYLNPKLLLERRIDDLLSRMTVEEKVGQLQSSLKKIEWGKNLTEAGLGGAGPVLRSSGPAEAARKANEIQKMALEKTRLGIPLIIHDEALHGLVGKNATSFPQSIGLAATWDTALVARVAMVIAKETRSRGIRQVLAPVINIARDARWGRVEETYGEDPLLSARMGVAYCRTVEGEGVITTPKHYVANVGDGGRDSYPAYFSERLLREVYFPPFEACIREAGSGSIMASYNSLNDVPCSAHPWLLRDVLRKEWGFKGFVVSDYGSVIGIRTKHGVAANDRDVARMALEAGLDVELPDIECYGAPLLEAARTGQVSQKALNEAVRNVLRAKFRLGLFEHPYVDTAAAKAMNDAPAHRALTRESARKTMVLLRNERNTLPLSPKPGSIAVIGPNADAVQLGGYSGFGVETVSMLAGIKNRLPKETAVLYEKGCDVGFASLSPIPSEFLVPPGGKPGEHGLKAEYFSNATLSGAPAFTRVDSLVHFEWAMGSPDSVLPVDRYSIRWTGSLVPSVSGTYTLGVSTDDGVRFYLDGKLLVNNWFDRGATLDALRLTLQAGRAYDIRIEYYENTGWAYASFDWERIEGVNPRIRAAVDAAKKASVAVVAVGIIEGEGYDRASLDLPGAQEELIRAVAATGTPTVVVLINGGPVTMKSWADSVGAILEAWYPGEEGGNAIADVLFGDENPGGKLPITFPQFVGQVPLYYNTTPTGRGDDYSDLSGKPMFPFGHGLSYTSFSYSNLQIAQERGSRVRVSVDVSNTGSRRGDEVVQLYLHDGVRSVARPVKELKGFHRVSLDPGERETVTFLLGSAELSFLNAALKRVVEPGITEVMVGSSSEDIRVKGSFSQQ